MQVWGSKESAAPPAGGRGRPRAGGAALSLLPQTCIPQPEAAMNTVFYTHCTDDWYEPVGCYKLEQSLKRFYPDIAFVRYGSAEIFEQMRLQPGLHWDIMIPVWGKMLAKDYDLVVHFDADSVVTGMLDDVLAGDYEVAGVRNN